MVIGMVVDDAWVWWVQDGWEWLMNGIYQGCGSRTRPVAVGMLLYPWILDDPARPGGGGPCVGEKSAPPAWCHGVELGWSFPKDGEEPWVPLPVIQVRHGRFSSQTLRRRLVTGHPGWRLAVPGVRFRPELTRTARNRSVNLSTKHGNHDVVAIGCQGFAISDQTFH